VSKHSVPDKPSREPDKETPADQLEFARLRVIVALAFSLWCQRRLMDLVHSFRPSDSTPAWLALLSQRRRVAANAQAKSLAAIEGFRYLVEEKAAGSTTWEH
jgi:hypothetical protein